jgi:hypothetical protein
MVPENSEVEKIHSTYLELFCLIIPWLSFILSFIPVSIMAYFVPVIIRTVIDFRTPVFFGWVTIHLYIALFIGAVCGFWAKRRTQNKLSPMLEKMSLVEEFETAHICEISMKSIRFGIEITTILTMGCVFAASLILRVLKEITWTDFGAILLICFGVVSIPLIFIFAARKKSSLLRV